VGRRRLGVVASVAAFALVAGFAPGVSAQDDPEAARRAAQERRAAVTSELDTLTASEAELEEALEELTATIARQQQELDKARRAVKAAEEKLEAAKAEVAATVAAIEELKALVVDRAVTEFMVPPTFDIEAFIRARDVNQASRLRSLIGAVAENDHNAAELLREAERQLVAQEAQAAEAAEIAVSQRESVAAGLRQLEASKAQQVEIKQALDLRIQDFKREADALAAEEQELTRIIEERAAEQRRLEAERLAAEKAAAEKAAADRAAAERAAADRAASAAAASAAAASRPATGGGGGGASVAAPAPAPAASPAPPASSGRLGFPAAGRVSSEFGQRWGRLHAGIDIAAPTGTSIHAAGGGTVYFTGWMGGYGNTVLIDHGGGLTTLYAHQSRIVANDGQRVERGQLIGYVGNTGNSTGPHLHFETRVNGSPQNPRNYL
jgi:murein DD-endopeptidase MepM/ murein hydrolase activator NlpD